MSIQGTSFAFLGAIISIGLAAKKSGATQEEILCMILGVCFVGSSIEMIFSRFIPLPRGGVMKAPIKDEPQPASV